MGTVSGHNINNYRLLVNNISLFNFTVFSEDLSSSLNTATLTSGAVIVGGLLILSFLLYMFDTWATARIDTMLLDYYGPDLYRKMTSSYDPEGVAAAIENIDSIHSGIVRI